MPGFDLQKLVRLLQLLLGIFFHRCDFIDNDLVWQGSGWVELVQANFFTPAQRLVRAVLSPDVPIEHLCCEH